MKFLVVAAFDPELARFRELMRDKSSARHVNVAIETIGVGLVEAAIGVTRGLARHAPTHALLLGTCGGFGVATGEVVAGKAARLVAASVVAGHAELPPPLRAEETLDATLHEALVAAGARSVQIANTVGVTVNDELAATLATTADVEHLEAFAFARACAVHGVAAGVLLGVANAVGARGRDEWRQNHVAMSARAAEVAAKALSAYVRV